MQSVFTHSALYEGMSGEDVKTLQEYLQRLPEEQGGSANLTANGVFNSQTNLAVFHFQIRNHLTPDGIFDETCQEKLQQLLAQEAEVAAL